MSSASLKLVKNGTINASRSELNLRACLKGGMSFRWIIKSESCDSTEYTGIIVYGNYAANNNNETDYDSVFRDYFRLNENLSELYSYWSSRDSKFKEKVEAHADVLGGIRTLRLDPIENLFSFICSSNNGIPRITQMVANMCIHFGKLIGSLDNVLYYTFPTIESLSRKGVDAKLKELKFGYRAKFIHDAAVYLSANQRGQEWLYSLRSKPYEEVHAELVKIPGVGKKVADCVCLLSMDKLDAIPVDTHVLQIAKNVYGFVNPNKFASSKKSSNSLSDSAYRDIANKFRDLWGKYAGWAQTVMFVDDLREFKLQKAVAAAAAMASSSIIDNENSSSLSTSNNKRSSKASNNSKVPQKKIKF